MSVLLVDTGSPGFTVGRDLPKLGYNGSLADSADGKCQLILVGCRKASWRRWSSWPTKALNAPSR
jgi:hypothetical protein